MKSPPPSFQLWLNPRNVPAVLLTIWRVKWPGLGIMLHCLGKTSSLHEEVKIISYNLVSKNVKIILHEMSN